MMFADTSGPCITLDEYLRVVRDSKRLNQIEETVLAARIEAGDDNALMTLVCANLHYVVAVAEKYTDRGSALEQLIDLGNIGLMCAARRWRTPSPVAFISYAAFYIRRTILLGLDGRLQPALGLTSSAGLSDPKWWIGLQQDAKLPVIDEKRPISAEVLFAKLEPIMVLLNCLALGLPTEEINTFEKLGRHLGWSPDEIRRVKEEEIRLLRNELE